jgi:ribosome biogenesis GTPase A
MMQEEVKLVDAIVYVLDARAYRSCMNPELDKIAGSKPVLYAITKIDLVTPSDLKKICESLTKDKKICVPIIATDKKSCGQIADRLTKIMSQKVAAKLQRGMRIVTRAMVVGVPNGGKSTLINSLSTSKKAVTGNRAGVTRGKQWVKINEYFELLDTPGTLYPKLSDQQKAKHLAYIGSIKDEVTDTEWLAKELAAEVFKINPALLFERFGGKINSENADSKFSEGVFDADEMLLLIAKSRGKLLRGGEPDKQRGAEILLDDFRKGRIGKIALEIK